MGEPMPERRLPAPLRIVERVSTWFGYISAALVLVSMLVISYAAVLRYVVGASTIWQTELVTYLLMFAAFCGAAYGLRHGDHVKIDLVVDRLGQRTRRIVRLIAAILGFCFVVAIAVMAFDMWWESTTEGRTSSSAWNVPLTFPHAVLPLGMTLVALQYLAVIAGIVQEIRHGDTETGTRRQDRKPEQEGIPT
ncbi:MAG: TRAP transporter small permease subunit [Actinophytocola sp.]|nr:TRAP transporter small permease subunit [Actinophytocola sp.]